MLKRVKISFPCPSGVSFILLRLKVNLCHSLWVKLDWTSLSIELKVPVFHSKKSCLPYGSLQEWWRTKRFFSFTLLHWESRWQKVCKDITTISCSLWSWHADYCISIKILACQVTEFRWLLQHIKWMNMPSNRVPWETGQSFNISLKLKLKSKTGISKLVLFVCMFYSSQNIIRFGCKLFIFKWGK